MHRTTCAIGLSLVMLLMALPTMAQPAPPATQASLHALSPEQFAATEEAQRVLNPQHLDHDLLSAAILQATNVARARNGMPPLRHAPLLDQAAKIHAEAMIRHDFFEHRNPFDKEIETEVDRVEKVGIRNWTFVAENLATEFIIQYESGRSFYDLPGGRVSYERGGQPIPPHTYWSFAQEVVDEWMNSPGHRQNILSPHARLMGSHCLPGSPGESRSGGLEQLLCVQTFAAVQ